MKVRYVLTSVTSTQRWFIAALVLLHGCSSPANDFADRPHIMATPALEPCARFVDKYVRSNRGWAEDAYKIALEQYPSSATVFRVSHIGDSNRNASGVGGGTSFFVEVDCNKHKVLRELKME